MEYTFDTQTSPVNSSWRVTGPIHVMIGGLNWNLASDQAFHQTWRNYSEEAGVGDNGVMQYAVSDWYGFGAHDTALQDLRIEAFLNLHFTPVVPTSTFYELPASLSGGPEYFGSLVGLRFRFQTVTTVPGSTVAAGFGLIGMFVARRKRRVAPINDDVPRFGGTTDGACAARRSPHMVDRHAHTKPADPC
ncbi:MAG TPA: hypothetical protein PKE29_04345 [Phycisphaerales bacterium]|nr:hypothetical protein [Phycisphaerales bacterium]